VCLAPGLTCSGFLSRLDAALESGKNVAVHCRAGIGRSSIVVGSLLVAAGVEPEEAFRRIEKARGRPVPDTAEQREWVAQNVSEAAASIQSHQN
jgi:protein-tyrosine phosphatase